MAKNITIREGDTTKQFTAKKLKMNLVGGGTTDFVPEDEVLDYVDLKDHTFNQAGTFLPSQFNCDGFRQVKIDIPANVKEKTITANGEYNAADDNVLGYSKVTVSVPGGGGGGPFTVRFFDDDRQTVLKTDANVPYGGSASCTLLDGTTVGGLYFKGWNPSPTNVKENMNCYPLRGEYQTDVNEIQDSWETICENKGAPYPIGSYKSLVFTNSTTTQHRFYDDTDESKYVDITLNGIGSVNIHMVKVAEGEDNSSSTWLSNVPLAFPAFNSYTWEVVETEQDWENSGTRVHMNGGFLADMPTCLKDTIKEVTKQTLSAYPRQRGQSKTSVMRETMDKIWTPSIKELKSYLTRWVDIATDNATDIRTSGNQGRTSTDKDYIASIVDTEYEAHGLDYASIYYPDWFNYTNLIKTRSVYAPVQSNMNSDTIQHNGRFYIVLHNNDSNNNFPFGFCL